MNWGNYTLLRLYDAVDWSEVSTLTGINSLPHEEREYVLNQMSYKERADLFINYGVARRVLDEYNGVAESRHWIQIELDSPPTVHEYKPQTWGMIPEGGVLVKSAERIENAADHEIMAEWMIGDAVMVDNSQCKRRNTGNNQSTTVTHTSVTHLQTDEAARARSEIDRYQKELRGYTEALSKYHEAVVDRLLCCCGYRSSYHSEDAMALEGLRDELARFAGWACDRLYISFLHEQFGWLLWNTLIILILGAASLYDTYTIYRSELEDRALWKRSSELNTDS